MNTPTADLINFASQFSELGPLGLSLAEWGALRPLVARIDELIEANQRSPELTNPLVRLEALKVEANDAAKQWRMEQGGNKVPPARWLRSLARSALNQRIGLIFWTACCEASTAGAIPPHLFGHRTAWLFLEPAGVLAAMDAYRGYARRLWLLNQAQYEVAFRGRLYWVRGSHRQPLGPNGEIRRAWAVELRDHPLAISGGPLDLLVKSLPASSRLALPAGTTFQPPQR